MSVLSNFVNRRGPSVGNSISESAKIAAPAEPKIISFKMGNAIRKMLNAKDLLLIEDAEMRDLVIRIIESHSGAQKNWQDEFPALTTLEFDAGWKLVGTLKDLPNVGNGPVTTRKVESQPRMDAQPKNATNFDAEMSTAMAQFNSVSAAIESLRAAGIQSDELQSKLDGIGAHIAKLETQRKSNSTTASGVPTTSVEIVNVELGIHESATQPGVRFEVYRTPKGQTRIRFV